MSAFKQFTTNDVVITPFNVNKQFTFTNSEITSSDVGIEYYLGVKPDTNVFVSSSALTTGIVSFENTTGVYHVIKQLYYSNYLSSSTGDLAVTQSLIPGADKAGDRYVGRINAPRYDNYLQTTLSQSRYFPTGSSAKLSVISIPAKLFGNNILPTSFTFNHTSSDGGRHTITDDGEGNLRSASLTVGQIFYSHGIAVFTTGGLYNIFTSSATAMTGSVIGFQSSYNIFESQYKCVIRENEFGYSLNPSLLSGSLDDTYYNFVTGSYFTPYVTSIGLYNDAQELLMVAKLAQPIPISKQTDLTFLISMDRI